jgi:uncharacterized protein YtpQ (UPF0354 family)
MFGLFNKNKRPRASAPEPTSDQIVPRIKHVNFRATVEQMTKSHPDSQPVIEPLVADLLVTYAFDLPESFEMFREIDRRRLGLSIEELRAKALANLQKQLPPVQQGGQPPVLMLAVGNNMEACLLLIDELWEKVSVNVPGKVVVSVPSRDVLMFSSSERPSGIEIMKKLAIEARNREPVHGLSEYLLAWDAGKWIVFDGDPAAT